MHMRSQNNAARDMLQEMGGKDEIQRRRLALKRFIQKRKLKVAPWADAAGISEGAIRNFLEGRSKSLSIRLYEALARAADATVAELTGAEGTNHQHMPSEDIAAQVPGLRVDRVPHPEGNGMVMIRELDVRATQGPEGMTPEVLEQNIEEHTKALYGFPRDGFQQLFGAPPNSVQIIEAIGDSNVPEILPGQRVLVHTRDRTPSPPGFFVLWDGLGVVIKRVQYIPNSDPPMVKISSANLAYDPYERTLGEAHILGRVLGNWRRL